MRTGFYKQYDFNEWWDSRRNRLLGNNSISAYRCPSDRNPQSTETNYVMVVGEDTVGGKPNETVSLARDHPRQLEYDRCGGGHRLEHQLGAPQT